MSPKAAAVKPAAAKPATVKATAVASTIIAGTAIDAASIKAGAVAVSAAIAETVADAIAPIVTAAVVRRTVIAAVASVLTTGERDREPRDECAQKNLTANHGPLPYACLNATCAPFVMETRLAGRARRIAGRYASRPNVLHGRRGVLNWTPFVGPRDVGFKV